MYPPCIVIFNAHLENDRLQGSTEYIQPKREGARLRFYWGKKNPFEGRPVGEGAAFVGGEFTIRRGLYDIPTYLGDQHYTWSEGLNAGLEWMLFVMILPHGYTLSNINPAPAGTMLFGERLALYWLLHGDRPFGQCQVSWTLSQLQSDPNQELVRLNRLKSKLPSMHTDSLAIDDASETRTLKANIALQHNPWKSGSFYLLAVVVVFVMPILAYRFVGPWPLPFVLICGLLLLIIIGALQLRNDDALKDESFLSLMRETLKRFPLLRSGSSGNRSR